MPSRSEQFDRNLSLSQVSNRNSRLSTSRIARKRRRSTNALREIKKYQKSTELLLRKLPFMRLVREVLPEGMRIESAALGALQEAAEALLITMFELSNICAHHAKRVTLMNRDVCVAARLSGQFNIAPLVQKFI